MIHAAFFCWLLASSEASRIREHEGSEHASHAKFGASCDDLQSRFHDRVTAVHASLDGIDEQSELSFGARTRLTLRMYGMMRTLRRARECNWVIENNSEDLDQMRGTVQQLVAGNACAEAARLEMEQNSNAQAIPRAMMILLSDDCEVPLTPESENIDVTPEERLQEAEETLQDTLEELTSADGDGSAFVQVDKAQTVRRFMRGVGVLFLMLFLLLACTGAALAIGYVLGCVALILIDLAGGGFIGGSYAYEWLLIPIGSTALGGIIGLAGCVNQLFNNLLPRLSQ